MIVIPIQTKEHLNDALIIVLYKDDWERMKQAEPVQIDQARMMLETKKVLHSPTTVVCYEADPFPLMKFLDKKDIIGALGYLQRGIIGKDTPIAKAIDTLGLSSHDY